MLNKERNIRATYTLYGNAKTLLTMTSRFIVKSLGLITGPEWFLT